MQFTIPVIGILRGIDESFFIETMQAAFTAGLEAIEITMNTSGAERIVQKARSRVPESRLLGMGTVRNIDECRRAIDSGAMFIVTPNLDIAVIEHASSFGIPTIAGALTPTEVYAAWQAGAAMVKVFPCGAMGGPKYIRELRGPFETLQMAAVGGVDITNVSDYFVAGASAVGVSASLFGSDALKQRDAVALGRNVGLFLDRCRDVLHGI
jgi:2-dehydro-3-deoxyphosphogluconate aldolase/(4S)-4-hydroxy-2-oxoglutarate aldolase